MCFGSCLHGHAKSGGNNSISARSQFCAASSRHKQSNFHLCSCVNWKLAVAWRGGGNELSSWIGPDDTAEVYAVNAVDSYRRPAHFLSTVRLWLNVSSLCSSLLFSSLPRGSGSAWLKWHPTWATSRTWKFCLPPSVHRHPVTWHSPDRVSRCHGNDAAALCIYT